MQQESSRAIDYGEQASLGLFLDRNSSARLSPASSLPKNPMLYAAEDDPDGESSDTDGALPLSYAGLALGDGIRTRDHLVMSDETVSRAAVRPATETAGGRL